MRTWTYAIAALVGLWPMQAEAQGFPSLAPDEDVIVGPEVGVGKYRASGTWIWDEAGVALEHRAPVGMSVIFPEHPSAHIVDGAIRARMTFGKRVDATLMFRATLREPLERLSGYGLSIEGNRIRFYRWDKGIVHPQGSATTVVGLRQRAGIEIVMFLAGPLINVNVYDSESLEQIVTLSLTDRRYTQGRVGLRAHSRQTVDTRLSLLSVLRSGLSRMEDPDEHLGGKRLALLPYGTRDHLPPEFTQRIVDDAQGGLTLFLSIDELTRLRRMGFGPTHVTGNVPWKYIDDAYRSQRDLPPVPTHDGFRLDLSYKDSRMVEMLLHKYAERYPDITHLEEIGRSVEGRAIWALKISDNAQASEPEPAILLDSAHHGVELLSIDFVLDAIQTLTGRYRSDPAIARIVNNLEIWCVPLVNPDGNQSFMDFSIRSGRKNNRDTNGDGVFEPEEGVDLNRNYPFKWGALGERGSRSWPKHYRYRGVGPASEPETRAMVTLGLRERYVAAISYHTSGTVMLSPYAIDGVKNPINDEAWVIAEKIIEATPRQPNGRKYRMRRKLYSVDGVSKDWHRHELGTLAYLIEGPYHNTLDPIRRFESVEASRPLWVGLMSRFLDGPSATGRVMDPDGHPLTAEVRVREVGPREGERWTSRPRDGLWARYFPRPGTYTIVASAPGYETTQVRRYFDGHVSELDLVLRPLGEPPSIAQ